MSQPQEIASPVIESHTGPDPELETQEKKETQEPQENQDAPEIQEKKDVPATPDKPEIAPQTEDKPAKQEAHQEPDERIEEKLETKLETKLDDSSEDETEDEAEEKQEQKQAQKIENEPEEKPPQIDTNIKRLSAGTESDDSVSASDTDDKFEDAVAQSPARSLTKRTVSHAKPSSISAEEQVDRRSEESYRQEDIQEPQLPQHKTTASESGSIAGSIHENQTRRKPSVASSRISNTLNLDNVSLDDDTPPSPVPKDLPPKPSSKTLSLNSISLPSMPWSPAAESTKSPVPPTTATLAPSPPAPQPPPPPSRKLTSPFSWLSRSSSKEREPPLPPPPTGRRNTGGSIATLASNPEMMLSRLEEEKDGDSLPNDPAQKVTLQDRFKQLRQQEEAARAMAEGDNSKYDGALGLSLPGDEGQAQEKPPSSPVPQPIAGLAPGTVSGVNAGPSAISEEKVDWDLWQSVVYEGPAAVARTSAEELNKAIATGIPSAIRGVVWQVLADSKNDDLEIVYKDLATRGTDKSKDRNSNSTTASSLSNGNLSVHSGDAVASSASSINSDHSGANGTPSPPNEKNAEAVLKAQAAAAAERKRKDKEDAASLQKLEKTIRRDLGARTSYSKYAAAAGLQEGLFGVCKAYALFDEGVGYAQGMNFLIMPLLFNMPEQEAFCLLVRLMNHYKLRDLFIQDMPGLHMHLYQFERLLEDFEPALYCHLHRKGISPHLYATQWFLTLFAYRFPLQLVLRIYDLIFSEGLSAILRFGIVLMQKNASILLGLSDMQQLTTYLKDKLFDVYIDKDPSQGSLLENGFFGSSSASIDKEVYRADQLVKDACEVQITPEVLKAYSTEWEEKTKAEKDRENELMELRTANHNLAIRIRKMEERVEVCDREQADLATELVHTKVENQELKDENDSMRGQVRELKIVIEKQPMEIEETWKLERDDLMKRNMHVHEENQRLEKELGELEEELVQTKLRYAEINSQHETLNRKWTDLKRQFA